MSALEKDPMYAIATNFCLRTHGKLQPLSLIEVTTLMHEAWDNAVRMTRHDTYLEVSRSCAGVAEKLRNPQNGIVRG